MKRFLNAYAYSGIKFQQIVLLFSVLLISVSCDKNARPPIVGTGQVSEISLTSAVVEGFIIFDGDSPIKSKGICWDTLDNPTIANNRTDEGEGAGSFSSRLVGLTPNTLYFARAYATNRAGTGYGNYTTVGTKNNNIWISTSDITSLTDISAISGGYAMADMGELITAKGVCWGTEPNPTLNDNKTIDGTGAGPFESIISGLTPGTDYYLRSYATDNNRIIYGPEKAFRTYDGFLTDADNNVYYTLLLGNQEWMGSNLKVTRFKNGDIIGTTNPVTKDIRSETGPEYQWACGGYEPWASGYGRLYTWYTATDSRGICPAGSHLPSAEEWSVLIDHLGGESYAGGKMKINLEYYRPDDPGHWYSPNWGATNESGFNAYGTGIRDPAGSFDQMGQVAAWWTATDSSSVKAYKR
jgi:uncharacterized protein (TIGR02145 family)